MTELYERYRMDVPQTRTTLDRVDAWWRAANHIADGLSGGSRSAVVAATLTYAHLNRVIVRRDQRIRFILGTHDAIPALTAVAQMEGAPVHEIPSGSLADRGRSYALAYAVGAALDEPGLIVAAMVDEDEAVSAWAAQAMHDPRTDGAVLPILYQPSMDRDEVRRVFRERGWEPIEIGEVSSVDDTAELHRCFAAALYVALDEIAAITDAAAADHPQPLAHWPMLVLRTPLDWPPAQVSAAEAARWFDADGHPVAEIAQAAPTGDRRMSTEW